MRKIALSIGFGVALMLMCTKDDKCEFNEIKKLDWVGAEDSTSSQGNYWMRFENNVWSWRIPAGDDMKRVDIQYDSMKLLEGHVLIFFDEGNAFIVAKEFRNDCKHVYLRDIDGNAHCLDIYW